MSAVPVPTDTLLALALKAQGGTLGPVGLAAAHCRFTQRVVMMEFIDGKPADIRWTDPMAAEEAEVLVARIAVIARNAGLADLAGPTQH